MVLSKNLNDRQYRSYFDVGADKSAVRVNDATISTNKLSVSNESVTFGSGTNKVVSLDKAPIYNSDGSQLGSKNSTSVIWSAGTATEVAYRQDLEDDEQFTLMNLHEIAIDYDTGRIRYKKPNSGTITDSVSYSSRQLNVELTAGSSTISIGAVKIEDGDSGTKLDVITQDSAFGTATNGLAMFGKYQATPTTYTDGDAAPVLLDANGRVVLSADIEIGAVELKNGESDSRAVIQTSGSSKSITTNVLIVQHLDSTGSSMPSGNTISNAILHKLTDGTNTAQVFSNLGLSNDLTSVAGGTGVAVNLGAANNGTLRVALSSDSTVINSSGTPQACGILTSGSSGYVAALNLSAARSHLMVDLQGQFDAYLSVNGGTSDTFLIPANSSRIIDNITMVSGENISAKNYTSGSSHGKLSVTVW